MSGRFVASDYLSAPKWQASLSFHYLPAAGLLDTARHMGAHFRLVASLDAALTGDISMRSRRECGAELLLTNAVFRVSTRRRDRVCERAGGDRAATTAFLDRGIQFDEDQSAQLEAHYAFDTRALNLRARRGC